MPVNHNQNSDPLVSVIIVTWNAKRYVDECLESLRTNSDVSMEVIVSDNASTDGTPELVQEKYPEAILMQNGGNFGFAKGNNLALARSRGKYLFLVNSDVVVPPGCFARIVEYMEAHPEVGMLGPQMIGPDGSICRSTMRYPTVWNQFCRALAFDHIFKGGYLMSDFTHDFTRDVEVLNGWFWAVRREAYEQVGGLDEQFFMYGEDIDWSREFNKAGWRIVFFSEANALHYGGSSSKLAPIRFYIEMQRANLQYWDKHNGRFTKVGYYASIVLNEIMRIIGHGIRYIFRPSTREESSYKVRRSVALLRWLIGANMPEVNLLRPPAPGAPRQLRESKIS